MRTGEFAYSFRFAGLTDIGQKRKSNQDEIILCQEKGFFAVSDGMGGLSRGEVASAYVKQAMPLLLTGGTDGYRHNGNAMSAAEELKASVSVLSDRLYEQGNGGGRILLGATLAGVRLVGSVAVFVCLGDSRGYVLRKYKKYPEQITRDMNVADILVREGDLTKEEAKNDPSSSRLTAFVGMPPPAGPETFTIGLSPGDRICLCSDGLYGMIEERDMARIMRSSRSPETVCRRLIDLANRNGGRDNISAVYIKIM